MQSLGRRLEPFRRKLVKVIAIKDIASDKIKSVVNRGKALGRMVFSPVLKVKDKLSPGIAKAKEKLNKAFKTIAVPVTVAVASTALALGGAVKSGMELEQKKVSMSHFIGTTNKDLSQDEVQKRTDSFMEELRNNANATPFETGEVIAAGSRAVAIAGGNTKDAMGMVKLAEDMAAASGGTKSISDAIEALADAKLGEMERLKEFGFKVSAEEFKSKGFEGVSADLSDFFGGASEKLATTGAGLLSTITGKMKSNFADFGLSVVEKLKPSLEKIIVYVDKMSPTFEAFGAIIADSIGRGVEAVEKFAPKMQAGFAIVTPIFESLQTSLAPIMDSVVNMFKTLSPSVAPQLKMFVNNITTLVQKVSPIISSIIDIFTNVAEILTPVISRISDEVYEKFGRIADIVAEKMPFIKEVFQTTMPIVADIMSVAWDIISPIIDIAISGFELFADVVETVFPKVRDTISSVWEFIKPIFEGLSEGLEKFSSGVSGLKDKAFGLFGGETSNKSSGGLSIGRNANGTNNWRGGPTWVGEEGPELLDLPRGSRILPNKESVSFAKVQSKGAVTTPSRSSSGNVSEKTGGGDVNITIPKLADCIIVREEADIDKIGEKVAKKIKKAKLNLA